MVKFSVNKSFFLRALNATRGVISTKNTIPVLSTIEIEVQNSNITLTGSNGQISIKSTTPTSNEDAGLSITSTGAILLEANFFISTVSSLSDMTLGFEKIKRHQIVLTSGKSEITLKGGNVDLYPRLQEMATENPLVLETKLLKSIVAEITFMASIQENRPILTGIHIVLNDHKDFKAIATDSYRMNQRKLTLENTSNDFSVVIPNESLREFATVFTDDIETVEVFFSDSQILFKNDCISFYTRLLEGNYPDTDRLLTNASETEVAFNADALRSAMERAYLISNTTQNGTVKLEIINNSVSAHVNSPEVGKANEELDTIDQSGNGLTISFNPTYLIKTLRALKSEMIVIHFISPMRPFTLMPGDDAENFIQLVTPVHTN